MAELGEHPVTESAPARRRVHPYLSVLALIVVVLVGLDLSNRAGAVVAEAPSASYSQLVSPMAVVAKSGLVLNALLAPDERSNVTVPMAVELNVESGDTLIALLARVGVVMSDAYAAVQALDGVFRARDVRAGWTLQVTLQPQEPPRLAALQSIAFQPSVDREIKVTRRETDEAFLATSIPHPLHRVSSLKSGTIDNGLFDTAMAAGVPHDLLVEAIALFSFDVDFQRDIRKGDEFELFYDTLNNEKGEVAKAGEIYFAKLVLRGKEMRYYRYTPHSGTSDLFSPEGKSIRKALLQTPVDATRISSTFGMRRHPILGYTRMHRGVDFAAPRGSPVRAAGDGVVVAAGEAGSYGNYVRIQHTTKYSTAYAHLTNFARGIKKGVRVRQGEVIAYVGSTGRATGPHLHYEVLVGGQQVNPRGVRLPAGETLAGEDLRLFKQRLQEVEAMRASYELEGAATIAQAHSGGCALTQAVADVSTVPSSGC